MSTKKIKRKGSKKGKDKNSNLHAAKVQKNDEFYTQLTDVSKELMHYKQHFKDKVILCNCDDPTESAFWKYFHLQFAELGLKKLIATHYDRTEPTYKMVYAGGNDNDVEAGVKTPLAGNGDFRNEECIELLKETDIVVTNPPFSLFREYVAQLMEHEMDFIIWGNNNAITYKEFFPLIKENKVWLGYTANKTCVFEVGEGYKYDEKLSLQMNDGKKYGKVPAISVFTNLDIKKRHDDIILWKYYFPEEYPKYDNYDAINVDKVSEIPCDYDGVMGVPITFLDKHNPEQFEILGLLQSSTDEQAGINNIRFYNDFEEMRQDGSFTGSKGSKANGNPVLKGKSEKGNYLYNRETGEYVHSVYARVVIRRKERKDKEVKE